MAHGVARVLDHEVREVRQRAEAVRHAVGGDVDRAVRDESAVAVAEEGEARDAVCQVRGEAGDAVVEARAGLDGLGEDLVENPVGAGLAGAVAGREVEGGAVEDVGGVGVEGAAGEEEGEGTAGGFLGREVCRSKTRSGMRSESGKTLS